MPVDHDGAEDPVARNRATPSRRTPDRAPTGWATTRRWLTVTAVAIVVSGVTLLVVILLQGSAAS